MEETSSSRKSHDHRAHPRPPAGPAGFSRSPAGIAVAAGPSGGFPLPLLRGAWPCRRLLAGVPHGSLAGAGPAAGALDPATRRPGAPAVGPRAPGPGSRSPAAREPGARGARGTTFVPSLGSQPRPIRIPTSSFGSPPAGNQLTPTSGPGAGAPHHPSRRPADPAGDRPGATGPHPRTGGHGRHHRMRSLKPRRSSGGGASPRRVPSRGGPPAPGPGLERRGGEGCPPVRHLNAHRSSGGGARAGQFPGRSGPLDPGKQPDRRGCQRRTLLRHLKPYRLLRWRGVTPDGPEQDRGTAAPEKTELQWNRR